MSLRTTPERRAPVTSNTTRALPWGIARRVEIVSLSFQPLTPWRVSIVRGRPLLVGLEMANVPQPSAQKRGPLDHIEQPK